MLTIMTGKQRILKARENNQMFFAYYTIHRKYLGKVYEIGNKCNMAILSHKENGDDILLKIVYVGETIHYLESTMEFSFCFYRLVCG